MLMMSAWLTVAIFCKIRPILVYRIKTGTRFAVNHDKLYNEICRMSILNLYFFDFASLYNPFLNEANWVHTTS